ncbi:helicase protein MOM1-like isoform X4 [Primulina tabacum]|uniref:helicase protein MOM1-like isoform X4 n=1 Tax=Primulina tabacum TaxID=48773 RepID=UPI003F5AB94E
MLSEIKIRGLRVVILYQKIVGPEGATIGDILDDFLRQRFGENTYDRVDARATRSRKQSAMDRFNKRETGQFVFLLENRACSSSIKLSSLDLIIIYDCDWNPANDLRALQKISIDSKVEQIKVFRLYSSCTVEERALVLAKQKPNFDTSLQNLSLTGRVTYDTFLMWGASYLFSKLDEYHAVSSSIDLRGLSGQLLLNEVMMEFHAIVSDNCEIFYINPLISKVTLHDGYYKSNSLNFGEAKIQLMDGVEPYIFWRNLLDVKNPQWKHLKGPCPQNRKSVQCLVEPPGTFGCENSDDSNKRKQAVNDKVDPSSAQGDLSEYPITQIAGYKSANYNTVASNQIQTLPTDNSSTNNNPNCMFGQSSFPAGVDTFESEERFLLLHKQERLHSFLQGEVTRICQLLRISDDVKETARKFLEYVINNHDARSDSPAIMQAFQLSLCWVAALISQQKVDKKHSFLLAKQHLNYECTEEQVNSVYSKMHSLIWMYLQRSENANDSRKNCLLADEVINIEPSNISEGLPLNSSSCKLKKVKIDIEEELFNEEHHAAQISLDEKLERMVKAAGNEIQHEMKKKWKKCEKLMKKLNRKQEEEVRELKRTLDEQSVKLEENHQLESAVIRSIHDQSSVAIFKLKILDDNFARKTEEHTLLKDMQLKDLKARHLAAWEEESQKEANWLAEAIACSSELRIIKGPQNLGSQSIGDAGCSQRNYVSPSDPSTSARAVTLGCNDPSATLCNLESVDSDNEVGIMSLERLPPVADKQLNHLIHSNIATRETGSTNLPVSGELVSCEIQLEEQNKEASNEVLRNVSDKVVRHVDDVVLPNASTEGDLTGLPDSVVNQIDRPDDMTDSGLLLNHVCAFSLDKVPEDEIHRHLVCTEVQDREPAVELPSTLQIDVATLKLVDTAMVFQSNHEESTTCNHELLHDIVVDASLSCDQSHLSGTEHPIQNKKRSPSQSAEAGETEELFDVFISQSCEPSQLHDGHLDLGPSSRINSDQSIEMFAKSPNNTAIAGAVVSTAELPNQAVQLRLDSSRLHGPRNLLVHPIQQVASWNSNPSSLGEPLEDEVERLRKEAEQLEKTHEDVMSQLRSDCEKEMEEIIAQIRSKYEAKIKDAEAEFRLKKNEVEKKRNIVLMNKKLAEAFRSKYVDIKASSHPGSQQAFPSGFMPLPSTRLPSADSVSRPPGRQTATPFQQGPQISGCSSRSSDISGITSAINLRVGRERYSPAPHLQSFTPTVPPLVGGQIRSPASHLRPFRSAAPPHGGGETHSHDSHIQPFRPVAPTSRALHQHLPKQKYRRLDELP